MRILLLLTDKVKSSVPAFRYLFIGLLSVSLVYLGLSLALPIRGGSAHSSGPHRAQTHHKVQTIYAPVVGLQASSGGEIVLNHRGINNKDVTPTFYTAEGEAHLGQALTLKPHEVRHVDLIKLIPPNLRGRNKLGGVSLSYEGHPMEVAAQVTLFGKNNSGSIDVIFLGMKDYKSAVQEAVWWMPDKVEATIILGNSSDSQVSAKLTYSTGESQDVQIGPRATETVDYRGSGRGNGSASSVKLEVSGPIGSLRAAGFVLAENKKMTSGIRFSDPAAVHQQHLYATNFRLKNTTPHLTLKNTSDAVISARPKFLPPSGNSGNPVELNPVTLQPRQAMEVDLEPLKAAAATRSDLERVSVQIDNSGPAGSLIGALNSIDRASQLCSDVPLRDSGPRQKSAGSYPWRLDGDYTSIASITNVSSVPAHFTVYITHEGGKYVLNPIKLAPGETAIFDFKKIRDEKIKDGAGQVIPASASGGQFYWSIWGGGPSARLIGRNEVVSASNWVSSSFSCGLCCPNSYLYGRTEPASFDLEIDLAQIIRVIARERTCYGEETDIIITFPDWEEEVPGICVVEYDPGPQVNQLFGIDAGATRLFAYWDDWSYTYDYDSDICREIPVRAYSISNVQVRPCRIPTGETTTGIGWGDAEGYPTLYKWRQVLTPTSINFGGRSVREQDAGGGTDTCHFQDSAIGESNKVSGGSWRVGSSNQWGDDFVGWNQDAVNYYRPQREARGLPMPCRATLPQRMQIICSSRLQTFSTYIERNILSADMGFTLVSSSRAGQPGVTRQWP